MAEKETLFTDPIQLSGLADNGCPQFGEIAEPEPKRIRDGGCHDDKPWMVRAPEIPRPPGKSITVVPAGGPRLPDGILATSGLVCDCTPGGPVEYKDAQTGTVVAIGGHEKSKPA